MAEATPTITIININSNNQTRIDISALTKQLSVKAQKTASNLLMIDSLCHSKAGILTNIDLVKHLFRAFAREQQRPKYCCQEAERDGDDTGVFQLQNRFAETHE